MVGAKAFDRKVSGKTAMKTTELATRASLTDRPIRIPTQAIEKPNSNKNRKPRATLKNPEDGKYYEYYPYFAPEGEHAYVDEENFIEEYIDIAYSPK